MGFPLRCPEASPRTFTLSTVETRLGDFIWRAPAVAGFFRFDGPWNGEMGIFSGGGVNVLTHLTREDLRGVRGRGRSGSESKTRPACAELRVRLGSWHPRACHGYAKLSPLRRVEPWFGSCRTQHSGHENGGLGHVRHDDSTPSHRGDERWRPSPREESIPDKRPRYLILLWLWVFELCSGWNPGHYSERFGEKP